MLGFAGSWLAPADIDFAKNGQMVEVGRRSRLSLYCAGSGSPTVLLESGFGGGTAATWMKLQPRLSEVTRTCSYDRAGYGFSELGNNLPRDLNRMVEDLRRMLQGSGEKGPYVLAGHSNGGLIIGAFADRYPEKVAGLMFFDAAVVLDEDRRGEKRAPMDEWLKQHLARIRECGTRAKKGLRPEAGDACVDVNWYAGMRRELAEAEMKNRAKVDFWRAYLSEAESNYTGRLSEQARARLPHRWGQKPVRVFIAHIARTVRDEQQRKNRERGERRQERVCESAQDCVVVRVDTEDHLVHNQAIDRVVEELRTMTGRGRL